MAERNYRPVAPVGECRTCGKTFPQVLKRGCAKAYCSEQCKAARPRPAITKMCDIDGCANLARSHAAAWCEVHYYRNRRKGSVHAEVKAVGGHTSCSYCNAATNGQKHCSSRCAARHARGNPRTKACVVCGAEFDPVSAHGPDAAVCSAECRGTRERAWARAHYGRAMQAEEGRNRYRANEYRRKARKRQAHVEDVDRGEVMRRSKWRCHLCGEAIPKAATWPSPEFGTVDHVLPLAAGGVHSYANCKAAHLRCNCSKGAKLLGQMGLPLVA